MFFYCMSLSPTEMESSSSYCCGVNILFANQRIVLFLYVLSSGHHWKRQLALNGPPCLRKGNADDENNKQLIWLFKAQDKNVIFQIVSIHKMRGVINTNVLFYSLQHNHTELRSTLILMENQPVSHNFLWDEADLITSLNPNVNLLLIILRRKPSQPNIPERKWVPGYFFSLSSFLFHMFLLTISNCI